MIKDFTENNYFLPLANQHVGKTQIPQKRIKLQEKYINPVKRPKQIIFNVSDISNQNS